MQTEKIYLIGSLRDKRIPEIGNELREKTGHEVFDDWFAPGPRADDHWKEYESSRGRSYKQALSGFAASHIFAFDKFHLDQCGLVFFFSLPADPVILKQAILLAKENKCMS